MRYLVAFFVAGLTAMAGQAGLAQADATGRIVALTQPAAVALAMRERGYRAKLTRNENDRPMIISGTGGLRFDIVFYGCGEDDICSGALLTAGFDLSVGVGLDVVNNWNSDRLIGRAFVDHECDPYLDHYIVSDPLMSATAFDRLLADWSGALSDFADFVGYGNELPGATVVTCGPGTDAI